MACHDNVTEEPVVTWGTELLKYVIVGDCELTLDALLVFDVCVGEFEV